MRALFDISCLDHERISGVGTYARHLGYALTQIPNLEVVGSYRLSRRRKLPIMQRHWLGRTQPYIPLWSGFEPGNFTVFHGPDFRVPNVRKLARVVTIHDLAYYDAGYTDPKFARQRIQLTERQLVKNAPDAVIAVSQFTKNEILKRFPHLKERVHAVWHGADHLLVPANKGLRPIAEPYFLFVGNLEARKNISGLIRAFTVLKRRPEHRDTRLVLVGKAGYGFEGIREVAKESAVRDHIILPGFISNIGLVNYYQWAEAFVYPSLYEGFGFPILEAMRLGCPVITSAESATSEVAGDAALFADPRSPEAIADVMQKLMENPSLRDSLIRQGRERGQLFTWAQSAKETRAVYEKALERRF